MNYSPISTNARAASRRHLGAGLLLLAALMVAGVTAAASPALAQSDEEMVVGVFNNDGTPTGHDRIAQAGFNTVIEGAYVQLLDEVAADGLNAIVWVGPYNEDTCEFEKDDAWIREYVGNVAGHEAILAYYIDDEPGRARVEGCPNVVNQVRERSDLVKSIDPGATTFLALAAGDGQEDYPWQYFTDTVDILGLVVYPCNVQKGCTFDHIQNAIDEAESDGVDRYWAIIQAFGDHWYKQPTYDELQDQINYWADNSSMEGYLLFKWEGLEQFSNEQLRALGSRFFDVPRGTSFFHSVEWMAEAGITLGCNPPMNDRFCPSEYVTRGQMAAFLVRALSLQSSAQDAGFVDDDGSVFEGAIESLAAAGITKGCNPPVNNRFCPGAYVTRGQLAAFLFRGLN